MLRAEQIRRRVMALGGYDQGGHRRAAVELSVDMNSREPRIPLEDFSVRELAEALIPNGDEFVRRCDPRNVKTSIDLREAQGYLDSTVFSKLTSQLLFNRVRERFSDPVFAMSRLVETIPSRLAEERFPGVADPVDAAADKVIEGQPIPHTTMDDDEVSSAKTEKRALIVAITKEAVFFDRTAELMARAGKIGATLGRRKEKNICQTVFDVGANKKGFIYNGTSYNVYYTSGGPLVNKKTGNELVTWDDIDESQQIFVGMQDPITGEAIDVTPRHVVVMPAKAMLANSILRAITVSSVGPASARATTTVSSNPVSGLEPYSTVHGYNEILASGVSAGDAAKYWLHGDISEAFGYVENWPITVSRSPDNSDADFYQDVVFAVKASERGVPICKNPWAVVLNTG